MPTKTHYIDGDNYQLRQIIFANTPKAIAQTKQIAQRFKGKSEYDTAKKIFDFLKNDITYRADTTHQKVKLPSALLREKVGDCKSYALFTGAILSNLNIGWKYVLVSYRNDPTPTHIYVVTDSGIIIDAVWGKFNSEKQPTHKFYHKPKDMRISTITGVKGQNTQIGEVTQKVTPNQEGIGAPRAFIWYRDSKGKDVPNKEAAKWRANQTLLAPARGIITLLFKYNAGGISTMISDLTFKKEGSVTSYPIPEKVSKDLTKRINDLRNRYRVSQNDSKISSILSQAVPVNLNPSNQALNLQSMQDQEKRAYEFYKGKFDKEFGSGAYDRYLKWSEVATKMVNDVKKKYTVKTTAKSKAIFGKLSNLWFSKGGDPWSLLETIQEGAKKKPRSKSFNYLIRKGMEKGLQVKDLGLLLRSVKEMIAGGEFSLGSKDSYVLGKGVGIGAEPVSTIATISANIKPIMAILSSLLTLYLMFKDAFAKDEVTEDAEGGLDTTDDSSELDAKLSSGWMLIEDAEAFNCPTPYEGQLTIGGTTIVKPNQKWFEDKFGKGGGEMFAGFGGIILPLLIGGGVLMALNTSKKIKK
jgi:hypothetical protein